MEGEGRIERAVRILGGLLSIVVMLDMYSGGQIRRWADRLLHPDPPGPDREMVYGVAREAERITRNAAKARKEV